MKNNIFSELYEKGFKLDELFIKKSSGIKTEKDDASIKFTKAECDEILENLLNLSDEKFKENYAFNNLKDCTIDNARIDLKNNPVIADLITYRTFDVRCINYTGKTNGFISDPKYEVMRHLFSANNHSLIATKQVTSYSFQHVFVTKLMSHINSISLQPKEIAYVFPLYLYPEKKNQQIIPQSGDRNPNLNKIIVSKIANHLGIAFVPEKEEEGRVCYINNPEVRRDYRTTFAPIDILDYIYAVLHSPFYRMKYREMLKLDFPRVPYPKDSELFWKLAELGGKLRQFHLLESPGNGKFIFPYPVDGNNRVDRIHFKFYENEHSFPGNEHPDYRGAVYINETQFFADVPASAWEFYTGGYQPAQKWLIDRKGRTLSFKDIWHYQKIITALSETNRLIKKIDEI